MKQQIIFLTFFFWNMIDFGKMYCKFHPYELITNFCNHCTVYKYIENCLVGLCATCICSHTQTHLKSNTSPSYQNVRLTFSQIHDKVSEVIEVLEADKERINLVMRNMEHQKRDLKASIGKMKTHCVNLVEKYFEDFQKEVQKKLASQTTRLGLHSTFRLQSLNANVSKEIQTLVNSSQDLNSSNFLQCIKRIKLQSIPSSLNFHQNTIKQLIDNESFRYQLETNKELFDQISVLLRKICYMKFSELPYAKEKEAILNQKQSLFLQKKASQSQKSSSNLFYQKNCHKESQAQKYPCSVRSIENLEIMSRSSHLNNNFDASKRGQSLKYQNVSNQNQIKYIAGVHSPVNQAFQGQQFHRIPSNSNLNAYQFYNKPNSQQLYSRTTISPIHFVEQKFNNKSSCIINKQGQYSKNIQNFKNNSSFMKESAEFIMKNNPNKINFVPQYIDMNAIKANNSQLYKKNDTKKGGITLFQEISEVKENNSNVASSVRLK